MVPCNACFMYRQWWTSHMPCIELTPMCTTSVCKICALSWDLCILVVACVIFVLCNNLPDTPQQPKQISIQTVIATHSCNIQDTVYSTQLHVYMLANMLIFAEDVDANATLQYAITAWDFLSASVRVHDLVWAIFEFSFVKNMAEVFTCWLLSR